MLELNCECTEIGNKTGFRKRVGYSPHSCAHEQKRQCKRATAPVSTLRSDGVGKHGKALVHRIVGGRAVTDGRVIATAVAYEARECASFQFAQAATSARCVFVRVFDFAHAFGTVGFA